MKRCRNCGCENREQARFCTECGCPLPHRRRRPGRKPPWLIALGIAAAAAALSGAGCAGAGELAEQIRQQESGKADSSGTAQEEENTQEEEMDGKVHTDRLLMGETIFDSSGTLVGDQYYGYDSEGRQRLMITERQTDNPASVTLILCEYEDGLEKRYTYVLPGNGLATGTMEAVDEQGILQQMQSFRISEWRESGSGAPKFTVQMQEDVFFTWDAAARTASGQTADGTQSVEYNENGQTVRTTKKMGSTTQEIVRDYDSEGNLSRQASYVDGALTMEQRYTYQVQGSETRVTAVTGIGGEQAESETIRSYYVPEISWEADTAAMYGEIPGIWISQEEDCYLLLTAGDLFALVCRSEEGIPAPFQYGFYEISSPEDIHTDTIYSFSNTVDGNYEDLTNVDLRLEGDILTFGEEVFVREAD